jgi:hypothetical protein
MLFLLPVCMYTVYTQAFGNRKPSFTGPEELLYLVYAFVTAFTTLVCVNDVFYWDDILYPAQAKNVFLFQLYGPWVVIRESLFPICALSYCVLSWTNCIHQPASCLRTCTPGYCVAYVRVTALLWRRRPNKGISSRRINIARRCNLVSYRWGPVLSDRTPSHLCCLAYIPQNAS